MLTVSAQSVFVEDKSKNVLVRGVAADFLPVANDNVLPVANHNVLPVANHNVLPVANDNVLPVVNDKELPVVNNKELPVVNAPLLESQTVSHMSLEKCRWQAAKCCG
jgi:hypothetical protein